MTAKAAQQVADAPEAKSLFEEKTLSADEVRKEKVQQLVENRVKWSLGAGLVPLPLFDMAALGAIQLSLLKSMAALYGVPFRKDLAKSVITSLVGSVAPVAVAGPVAGAAKLIPVVGYAAGAATMCALGAASTYAVGRVFTLHFEAGGTLQDFDVEAAKPEFKEQFEQGKDAAQKA